MANDVFISYSSEDVEWADELEKRLKQTGLGVFRDNHAHISSKKLAEIQSPFDVW
jgi:hypothetical protein